MTTPHHTRLGRLRRPEYTGDNRCLPCTAVNVVIAAVVAVGVGALLAVEFAAVVLTVALASIWLRGYLVPGTPALTKRYLPERVLRWFGKGHDARPPAAIDAEAYLVSTGVLVETPDGRDLAFAPWFASAWQTCLVALRDAGDTEFDKSSSPAETAGGPTAVAEPHVDGTYPATPADVAALSGLTGVDVDDLSLRWRGGAAFAHVGGERIGHWESRPAFLADVAADRALTAQLDDWASLPLASRSGVLGALRLFVERCPTCEGMVQLEERVVESCCSSYDVVAGRCTGCNARLFELDLPPSLADAQ